MFKTILVPLDHSALAERALVPSADIARKLGARLDVVLVHEQPKLANLRRSDWNNEQLQEERRYVEGVATRLINHGVQHCTHAVLTGDVEDAINARAHEIGADLIVMTSHGATGFSRARLGSVAYALVQESELPVLVLRDSEDGDVRPGLKSATQIQRILVPLDGSPGSLAVLPAAVDVARSAKGTIVLLRVVEPVPMFGVGLGLSAVAIASGVHPFVPASIQDIEATQKICAKAQAELAEMASLLADEQLSSIESHVVVATHPASAIIDYAAATNVDMIAMSTHGRGLSRWLLGSVADAVLRTSRFPLLLSRPMKSGVPFPVHSQFQAEGRLLAEHAG